MTRARDLASGQNGIRPFAFASGTGSAGTGTGVGITLPAGRFTATPIVLVSPSNSTSTGTTPRQYSISTTGFSVVGVRSDGTVQSIDFSWVALQMTSGSGAG